MSLDIQPEIIKEGFAVCHKDCLSFKKNEGSGKVLPTILCDALQDSEVRPRTLCVPWIHFLLKANKEGIKALEAITEKMKVTVETMTQALKKRDKEIAQMQKDGLTIRQDLVIAKKIVANQKTEIAKLNEDVMVEDLLRQHQWVELKAVQEFRTKKKKHDEKLEKALADLAKARTLVNVLEAENKRLIAEDESKAKVIKKLQAVSGQ